MSQESQITFLGAGHPFGSWKFGFFQLESKPNIYLKLGFIVLFTVFTIFSFGLRDAANSF